MKISRLVLLSAIAALAFTNLQAQTADEIINKWVEAMGGKDKLSSIKTVYTEDDLNIMNNIAPHTTYIINGKGSRSETDFNGQKIIDCYTVDSGWNVNPLVGINTPTDMLPSQVKLGQLQLDAAGPLFNYASKGSKAELQGKESLNGATSYKLKLTTATGIELNFFIDSVSSYIVKEIIKTNAGGQDLEITTITSDYRKTGDGFVMPFAQEISFPGLSLTITSKKIDVNNEIDPAIFNKPGN
ncbi:MAG: hypothetical protein ABI416_01065 [Ginsengibacter sp.]